MELTGPAFPYLSLRKTLVMADFDSRYLVKLLVSRHRLHSILADFVFDTNK